MGGGVTMERGRRMDIIGERGWRGGEESKAWTWRGGVGEDEGGIYDGLRGSGCSEGKSTESWKRTG